MIYLGLLETLNEWTHGIEGMLDEDGDEYLEGRFRIMGVDTVDWVDERYGLVDIVPEETLVWAESKGPRRRAFLNAVEKMKKK